MVVLFVFFFLWVSVRSEYFFAGIAFFGARALFRGGFETFLRLFSDSFVRGRLEVVVWGTMVAFRWKVD